MGMGEANTCVLPLVFVNPSSLEGCFKSTLQCYQSPRYIRLLSSGKVDCMDCIPMKKDTHTFMECVRTMKKHGLLFKDIVHIMTGEGEGCKGTWDDVKVNLNDSQDCAFDELLSVIFRPEGDTESGRTREPHANG